MIGRQSQRKAIQRLSGASGAKLLRRYPVQNNTNFTLTIPAGAGWIVARTVGPGGGSNRNGGTAGGGGAFAREDRVCSPGQALVARAYDGAVGGTSSPTQILLAGTVICQAAPGNAGTESGPGTGGAANDCIGTVRRSGANGSNANVLGQTGQTGGPGGQGSGGYNGGGSGGETDALDVLITGGRGADGGGGASEYGGRGGFPGGGASIRLASGNTTAAAPGGDGQAVIELWSGKP